MFIDSLLDDVGSGIEKPGIQSSIRIEYFADEQWTMKVESNKIIKWKQWTKVEQKTNNKSNNNNNNTLNNWQTSIIHYINKSRVSLLK